MVNDSLFQIILVINGNLFNKVTVHRILMVAMFSIGFPLVQCLACSSLTATEAILNLLMICKPQVNENVNAEVTQLVFRERIVSSRVRVNLNVTKEEKVIVVGYSVIGG